jgi:hypothetical protein
MMVMRMNEDDGYVEGEVGHNRMMKKEKEKDREIPPPRHTRSIIIFPSIIKITKVPKLIPTPMSAKKS